MNEEKLELSRSWRVNILIWKIIKDPLQAYAKEKKKNIQLWSNKIINIFQNFLKFLISQKMSHSNQRNLEIIPKRK